MRSLLLIGAFVVSVTSAAAQEPAPPGATACTGCHAAPGTALPTLQNLSAEEIADAMRAFRTGERPATVMNRIAKGFSDEESRAIALWLAAERTSK